MATQITCIVPAHSGAEHHIDRVGGDEWSKSEAEVIEEIEGGAVYYVEVNDNPVQIEVSTHAGRQILRTVTDNDPDNNLLSLPRCE